MKPKTVQRSADAYLKLSREQLQVEFNKLGNRPSTFPDNKQELALYMIICRMKRLWLRADFGMPVEKVILEYIGVIGRAVILTDSEVAVKVWVERLKRAGVQVSSTRMRENEVFVCMSDKLPWIVEKKIGLIYVDNTMIGIGAQKDLSIVWETLKKVEQIIIHTPSWFVDDYEFIGPAEIEKVLWDGKPVFSEIIDLSTPENLESSRSYVEYLPMLSDQAFFYEEAMKDHYATVDRKDINGEALSDPLQIRHGTFTRLRQICSGFTSWRDGEKSEVKTFANIKMEWFTRVLEITDNQQFIIKTEFEYSGAWVKQACDYLDIRNVLITADVANTEELLKRFNAGEFQALIISGNVSFHDVRVSAPFRILYEVPASRKLHQDFMQMTADRGTHTITIQLVISGTIEEAILKTAESDKEELYAQWVQGQIGLKELGIVL